MKRLSVAMSIALATVLLFTPLASAYVSITIEIQPRLVMVPGAPVYYAPELPYNYFFYAGRYYVFIDGVWYVGPAFRGPWLFLPLVSVPQPLLVVPVEYYRVPLAGWYRGGLPPWARHRVEFREREERARQEFERERREHREGRLGERRERERPRPPAVQPERREHREGRLQERREPERQGPRAVQPEPRQHEQAPRAAQPEPREHREGRPAERGEREGKGHPSKEPAKGS